MLKKVRIALATVFIVGITLLFLNLDQEVNCWLGWMAKLQFLPALLSLNVVAIVIVLALTVLFGRLYCSVICPLGVMQDVFAWIGKLKIFRLKKKGKLPNKYSYSKPKTWLRVVVLVAFVAFLVAGFNFVFVMLAPYSAYGRIVASVAHPMITEVSIVAGVTALMLFILAFMNGRTYCNSICPVGTVLGFVSKYSWLKMRVDDSKCKKCGLCAKNCKAACIDPISMEIDFTRCVSCGDCEDICSHHAISYGRGTSNQNTVGYKCTNNDAEKNVEPEKTSEQQGDLSRRSFLGVMGIAAATVALKAQEKTTDGGFAPIVDKQAPNRKSPLTPPGSLSARNLQQHCTACQLCISNCPNNVLRPSTSLEHLMQPEMGYENGYCRPECTICSTVCPAGAIKPITREEKSAIQIGHAVWVKKNCIPLNDELSCGNCARHCPTGSIQMVPVDKTLMKNESGMWIDDWEMEQSDRDILMIPVINTETCIGCGACENLCPARPFSAIYVVGHEVHREV